MKQKILLSLFMLALFFTDYAQAAGHGVDNDKSLMIIIKMIAFVVLILLAILIGWLARNFTERKRVHVAIMKERAKWLAEVRQLFSDFHTHLASRNTQQLYTTIVQTSLYLKPVEPPVKVLLAMYAQAIAQAQLTDDDNYIKSTNAIITHFETPFQQTWALRDILYIQQVILKSEWKRTTVENDIGKRHSMREMLDIYNTVAIELDTTLSKQEKAVINELIKSNRHLGELKQDANGEVEELKVLMDDIAKLKGQVEGYKQQYKDSEYLCLVYDEMLEGYDNKWK